MTDPPFNRPTILASQYNSQVQREYHCNGASIRPGLRPASIRPLQADTTYGGKGGY